MLRVSLSALLIVCAVSWATAATATNNDKKSDQKTATTKPFRLLSDKEDARLRRFLPRVDNQYIDRLLQDPRLVLYTDAEIPQAYQFFDGLNDGVHSPRYNISANGSEPHGNGNREFPWSKPAGTHRCDDVRSFRFMYLPTDNQGKTLPVVYFPNRQAGGYSWIFPVGTVMGEVLTLHGPDGQDYTFEVRIRQRERTHWEVDAFRPYPTAASLVKRIKQLRPDWEKKPELAKTIAQLESKGELNKYRLQDKQPGREVIDQVAAADYLPDLKDDQLVRELLSGSSFHSALGEVWRGSETKFASAPSTHARFHIVPAAYDAGYIAVESQSCMRCHETVDRSVREFNAGRDWYGRIRGSDGIFSFHPFDPSCISGNGFGGAVRFRSSMVQAGVIARYDSDRHPTTLYTNLSGERVPVSF